MTLKSILKGILRRMYHFVRRAKATSAVNAAPPDGMHPVLDQPLIDRYIRREKFIITDLVSARLPQEERFIILDGGAREALSDPRWRVFDPARTRLFGFEPDENQVAELNEIAAERGLDYRYYATGIWGCPATVTFHENKSPGGGSFYPQNTAFTDRWKFENAEQKFYARDIFHPVGTSQWTLTSVDAWAAEHEIRDIDFMKLNVQGAELEILRGSESLLGGVIGLMVEISFVESYRDRPFFSDIDAYLRSQQFTFFDLIGHHYMGRARSPITASHAPGLYPLWGQLIEGHGVYFRDPIDMEQRGYPMDHLSTRKLLKLVCFAEVFGQIEYAFELLDWLASRIRPGEGEETKLVKAVLESAQGRYRQIMGGWAPLDPLVRRDSAGGGGPGS